MTTPNKLLATILLILLTSVTIHAVTLPQIFSDNMVLQRDKPIRIWGWATKGESITITLHGQTVKTKADKNGTWAVVLNPMTFGGPFELSVQAKSGNLTLKNILIGDVWICSGQSNMEWTLNSTKDAAKEIAEANYPKIRMFTVQKAQSYVPEKDLKDGVWQECNPKNSGDFSAVAYFFGRKLSRDLDIPIGLINSSWGGTNIQAWISWDIMSKKDAYKNTDIASMQKSVEEMRLKERQFEEALKNEKGIVEKWFDPSNTTGWKNVTLPKLWEQTEIGDADGIVWFKKEITLSSGQAGSTAVLNLGPIDDQDETYINGTAVGSTHGYNVNRVYTLQPGALKEGKNTIVVKVTDTGGGGGIYGKPEQVYLDVKGRSISLAGDWLYKPSILNTTFGIKQTGPNAFPSQLYNAMIAPIIQYPVKGGIWYQGESNAGEAYRYRTLFPEMINDWRSKWGYEFPFYWVQLANFMAPDATPVQSEWAELREAQSMTMSLPQTGQAVIIDIGEEHDIHPRNKQDVGYRLALAAMKGTYGKDIVYSGPVYQSMKKDGNKIILSFTNAGSGLITKDKYGYVRGFAIAGDDQKFVWAKAYLDGNNVVVYSDVITNPTAVRYAWGNNPDDASLYNKEGLPASPFRTDTWPGISAGAK